MTLGLSSLLKPSGSQAPSLPVLTFLELDNSSQIKAIDSSGQEVARFVVYGTEKLSFTICRVLSPDTPPVKLCSAKGSSLTCVSNMVVHGQEFKLKYTLDSKTEVWVVKDTTMSTLKWRPKSGGQMELEDVVCLGTQFGESTSFRINL